MGRNEDFDFLEQASERIKEYVINHNKHQNNKISIESMYLIESLGRVLGKVRYLEIDLRLYDDEEQFNSFYGHVVARRVKPIVFANEHSRAVQIFKKFLRKV